MPFRTIVGIMKKNRCLFVPTFRALKNYQGPQRKSLRPNLECKSPKTISPSFVKELQYSRIDAQVIRYVADKKEGKRRKVEEAKSNDMLQECVCCYSEDILLEDTIMCKNGHIFCAECVQQGSNVAIGEGKLHLECFENCQEIFDISCLEKALKPEIFSKWFKKIQVAEIHEAGLHNLEDCPFCPYVTIMDSTPEENKLFQCLNPECATESCRLCHELSHVPFKCDEYKSAEVRKRTYIENKMTEALIRNCSKCTKPFVKTQGCNRMQCQCGGITCYICRKAVNNDYTHFYGPGRGPEPGRACALYSKIDQLHAEDVSRGAKDAKREMDVELPDIDLKYDPTSNMDNRSAK